MARKEPGPVTFESNLLRPLAAAFGKRRKALKYNARSFTCSREEDRSDGVDFERLNADFNGLLGEHVRLSIWEDGELWVNLSRSKKRGYEFNHEARSSAWDMTPGEVVERFERTLELANIHERSSLREELRALWKKK